MSKTEFRLEGYKELLERIDELGDSVQKQVNKALKNGATQYAEKLEQNAPDSRIRHNLNKKKLKVDVTVSNVRTDRETGEKYVVVHFKTQNWRVHFQEFGTIKQKAQPFVQPTFESETREVQRLIAEELKKGLNF